MINNEGIIPDTEYQGVGTGNVCLSISNFYQFGYQLFWVTKIFVCLEDTRVVWKVSDLNMKIAALVNKC